MERLWFVGEIKGSKSCNYIGRTYIHIKAIHRGNGGANENVALNLRSIQLTQWLESFEYGPDSRSQIRVETARIGSDWIVTVDIRPGSEVRVI